jgi:preprotein translocase subunit SecY
MFGPTEAILLYVAINLIAYFSPSSNDVYLQDLIETPFGMINGLNIITLLGTVSGLHYTLENLIYGFAASKNKAQAIWFIMPLIVTFIALYVSPYS